MKNGVKFIKINTISERKIKMQGKRPTREQRKILERNKLDTYKWLVQKDTTSQLHIINSESKEKRILSK